ncbi:hypothetical protein ACFOVU_19715 [Nocardiopsis sediminis]|uniref:Uncharacterized protein n=1 Tax=Nocardiopsis sediminis TaxID=1778267 RepID=A0ABV8FQK9_9ACTN
MGYETEFTGRVAVHPPLNIHEIAYLRRFAGTRRMHRTRGPYYVDGGGHAGMALEPDVLDHNRPPDGQPALWCKWEPTGDGGAITWNEAEKFYGAVAWMAYLIDTFLKPGAAVEHELAAPVPGRDYPGAFRHFTFDHILDGAIDAVGEEPEDVWRLTVTANTVGTEALPDPRLDGGR